MSLCRFVRAPQQPPQADHREHERDVAVAGAELRPDGRVGVVLGQLQAGHADDEDPDQLGADCQQRQAAPARGEREGRDDVDDRGKRAERVRHRRLGGLGGELERGPAGGRDGEHCVDEHQYATEAAARCRVPRAVTHRRPRCQRAGRT